MLDEVNKRLGVAGTAAAIDLRVLAPDNNKSRAARAHQSRAGPRCVCELDADRQVVCGSVSRRAGLARKISTSARAFIYAREDRVPAHGAVRKLAGAHADAHAGHEAVSREREGGAAAGPARTHARRRTRPDSARERMRRRARSVCLCDMTRAENESGAWTIRGLRSGSLRLT